jgi:hypothetical protein
MTDSGWSVLRFWNVDVLKERQAVLATILAALNGHFRERIVSSDLRFIPSKKICALERDTRPLTLTLSP